MKIDLSKFWILALLILILAIPLGAAQVNNMLNTSKRVVSPQAHSMNIKIHSNNNYTDKLNATNANTYHIKQKPIHGTVTLNKTCGKFTYTPNPGYVGTDTFKYNANDGKTYSNTATVKIIVYNNKPLAQNLNLNLTHDQIYNGQVNATDPNGDKLTYKIAAQPTHGTVTLNETSGKFTYTPNPGYVGIDTFTYDANDGITKSKNATVKINVKNSNPVSQDMQLNLIHDRTYHGVLNATDSNGDKLTYKIVSQPTNGILNLNSDGTYNYTPNKGFVGSEIFTYSVNDGIADSKTSAVTITVTNQAPIVKDMSCSFPNPTTLGGRIDGNDPDGDNLTYKVVSQPLNGTLTFNPDGRFTYTPNIGFKGTDSFTYSANDGVTDSNTGTVTLAFENNKPIAYDQNLTISPVNTTYKAYLFAEDFDEDTLTFKILDQPKNGTLTLGEWGEYTYTPNPGFTGTDRFTYNCNDGKEDSNTATINLKIKNAPKSNDNKLEMIHDRTMEVLSGLDAEGDPVTYNITELPKHGNLIKNMTTGKWKYIPNEKFIGTDSFKYKINYGISFSNTAKIEIKVINHKPIANGDYLGFVGPEDFSWYLKGSDPDGDKITYKLVTPPPGDGTLTLRPDGTFTYHPGYYYCDFYYCVNDGIEDSDKAKVTLSGIP